MKFIQIDIITGDILALEPEKEMYNYIDENWFTISYDAYKMIVENNGKYIIDKNKIQKKIKRYKYALWQNEKDVIVVDIDLLIEREHSINGAILAKIDRNNLYSQLYIDNGIIYNNIKYPFKYKDRIQYMENIYMITNKMLNNNIPINSEYGINFVDLDTFKTIYNKQLRNKFYHEVYVQELNTYIKTLNDYTKINLMQYETKLPQKYLDKIENKMKDFKGGI